MMIQCCWKMLLKKFLNNKLSFKVLMIMLINIFIMKITKVPNLNMLISMVIPCCCWKQTEAATIFWATVLSTYWYSSYATVTVTAPDAVAAIVSTSACLTPDAILKIFYLLSRKQ